MRRDKLRHQVRQVHQGSDTRDSQEVTEVNGRLKLFLPQRHNDGFYHEATKARRYLVTYELNHAHFAQDIFEVITIYLKIQLHIAISDTSNFL